MNDNNIKRFYSEVCDKLGDNYKIILENNRKMNDEWIEYDTVKWELEEPIKKLVEKLKKDNTKNFEEKVLCIYEYICLNYIYDTNVLYFFKKEKTEENIVKYIAIDWYGRIVNNKWKENRYKHNRRVCYELARFYAKAINELLTEKDECEAFMLGDKENLHYVVGLSGKEYSLILDVDDFNKIKDLTRLKLGLTINGITILRDESKKFTNALCCLNKKYKTELEEFEEAKQKYKDKDFIQYIKRVGDILIKYNIDSQGFCEVIRYLIDKQELEVQVLWKEVKGVPEKRYEKCILFRYNYKTYLLDSVDKMIKNIDGEEIDNSIFIPELNEVDYPYFGG